MIELVSFGQLRAAQALTDYLDLQKIPASISRQENNYLVSVHNEEDLEKAAAIVEEFLQNPNDEKFLRASWESTGEHYIESDQYPSFSFREELFSQSGIFTILVVVICSSIYGLMLVLEAEEVFNILRFPELNNFSESLLNFPKLITPIFVHFSAPHLIFNLLWWWVFGGQIERLQSSLQLFLLTLTIGFISNVAQYFSTGANFGGLSGVVYGVLGYCWIWGKLRPQDNIFLPNALFNFMIAWLLLGYTGFLEPLMGKIANEAHLGGLLSGLVLGFIFVTKRGAD